MNLERHLRLHTGETPYKCQICNRRFKHHRSLSYHMKVHCGRNPHKSLRGKGHFKTHKNEHLKVSRTCKVMIKKLSIEDIKRVKSELESRIKCTKHSTEAPSGHREGLLLGELNVACVETDPQPHVVSSDEVVLLSEVNAACVENGPQQHLVSNEENDTDLDSANIPFIFNIKTEEDM